VLKGVKSKYSRLDHPKYLVSGLRLWRLCTKSDWSNINRSLDLDKYLRTNIEDL